ncbi:MAG: hypothetical protein IPG17_33170 [Sandaracinaceae bacterium]|nr:hypothetical protein [Sandaracinaceae bacterium]
MKRGHGRRVAPAPWPRSPANPPRKRRHERPRAGADPRPRGKPEDARLALEGIKEADPEIAEVRPLVLRAQVFTFFALKKRGLAAEAMERLVLVEPNIVMSIRSKGAPR